MKNRVRTQGGQSDIAQASLCLLDDVRQRHDDALRFNRPERHALAPAHLLQHCPSLVLDADFRGMLSDNVSLAENKRRLTGPRLASAGLGSLEDTGGLGHPPVDI